MLNREYQNILPAFKLKLKEWASKHESAPLEISHIEGDLLTVLLSQMGEDFWKSFFPIFVFPDDDKSEAFLEQWKSNNSENLAYIPHVYGNPYQEFLSSSASEKIFFGTLNDWACKNLFEGVVCTSTSLISKLPPKSFFIDKQFIINRNDCLDPDELAEKCVGLGYTRHATAEEPGHFSVRGEIFDIYPFSGNPVRIHFFDIEVDEIFTFDIETQRTNREVQVDTFSLGPSLGALISDESLSRLRKVIPSSGPNQKAKYQKRNRLFELLKNQRLPENLQNYFPLFFEDKKSFFEWVPQEKTPLVFYHQIDKCEFKVFEFLDTCNRDLEIEKQDPESLILTPEISEFFFTFDTLLAHPKKVLFGSIENTHEKDLERLQFDISSLNIFLSTKGIYPSQFKSPKELIKIIFQQAPAGKIIFCYRDSELLKELEYLIKEVWKIERDSLEKIYFEKINILSSYYISETDHLLISETELFGSKSKKARKLRKRNKKDIFAEYISTLKSGDFVIHQVHGIGKFLGFEKVQTSNGMEDFLTVEYENSDKVYIPPYKLDIVQKHADADQNLKLANLRKNSFLKLKDRAKQSAKKLAFDFIKLQAERKLKESFLFKLPSDYEDFSRDFPFEETDDQASAIIDVIDDLTTEKSMDRLVCGDVGFGKTEVAMRAAFIAVSNSKQVAVVVPTTILALQHYHSFVKRFKNFSIEIEFLSRLKKNSEAKQIVEKVKLGKIDIIIGTHKLLLGNMDFKDLGLIIVDEEQRFGVNHKEKLKLLKPSIDTLTLTATPIPRTLQFSLLGLKDLSIIQTAPPRRQSIKTFVINYDKKILKEAIDREMQRGGQIFFVHNRVQDIEVISSEIRELCPTAKILVAHGQLPERDLEDRMTKFYQGTYDILIATTIIESGIDIPNANTLIVNKADNFGLSQLHQLRGRIGRSERKAYAYFVLSKKQKITDIALKRLKALQLHSSMGSGFNIASSDLEIRGAGDLLGAEQSGHLNSIGIELYLDLLNEAIAELQGQPMVDKEDIDINISTPAFIPDTYISDPSSRLKYYKRMSSCESHLEIEDIRLEQEDLFGKPPIEVDSLILVLKAKILLQGLAIQSVSLKKSKIIFSFNEKKLESNAQQRDHLIDNLLKTPNKFKIQPKFKVVYQHTDKINQEDILQILTDIARQIKT